MSGPQTGMVMVPYNSHFNTFNATWQGCHSFCAFVYCGKVKDLICTPPPLFIYIKEATDFQNEKPEILETLVCKTLVTTIVKVTYY